MVSRSKNSKKNQKQTMTLAQWEEEANNVLQRAKEAVGTLQRLNDTVSAKVTELTEKEAEMVDSKELETLIQKANKVEVEPSNPSLQKIMDLEARAKSVREMGAELTLLKLEETANFATETGFLLKDFKNIQEATQPTKLPISFKMVQEYFKNGSINFPAEIIEAFKSHEVMFNDLLNIFPGIFTKELDYATIKVLLSLLEDLKATELQFTFEERLKHLSLMISELEELIKASTKSDKQKDISLYQKIEDMMAAEFKTKDLKTIKKLSNLVESICMSRNATQLEEPTLLALIDSLQVWVWRLEASGVFKKHSTSRKAPKKVQATLSKAGHLVLLENPQELKDLVSLLSLKSFSTVTEMNDEATALMNSDFEERMDMYNDFLQKTAASSDSLQDQDRKYAAHVVKFVSMTLDLSTETNLVTSCEEVVQFALSETSIAKQIFQAKELVLMVQELKSVDKFRTTQSNEVESIESITLSSMIASEKVIEIIEISRLVQESNFDFSKVENYIKTLNSRYEASVRLQNSLDDLKLESLLQVDEDSSTFTSKYMSILRRFQMINIASQSLTKFSEEAELLLKAMRFIQKGDDILAKNIYEAMQKYSESEIYKQFIKKAEESKINFSGEQSKDESPKEIEIEKNQETSEESKMVQEENKQDMKQEEPKKNTQVSDIVTLEEALEHLDAKTVPNSLKKRFSKFSEFKDYIQSLNKRFGDLKKLEGGKVDYYLLKNTVPFLRKSLVKLGPVFDKCSKLHKEAGTFVKKIFSLAANEVEAQADALDSEYASLGMKIEEYDRLKADLNKDREIMAEVQKALSEKREELALIDLAKLRNRFDSARYYSTKSLKLKLEDVYIMALIRAYKNHDKQKGKPVVSYAELRELTNSIKFLDRGEKKLIKPDNGAFMCKLFVKVKEQLKKDVYSLNSQELQAQQPNRHFKRFVDLSNKIREFKNRLLEKACMTKENTKRRRAIQPSGKKSIVHRKIVQKHSSSGSKYILCKPSFENRITSKHRSYYMSTFCFHIRNNKHLKVQKAKAVKIGSMIERNLSKSHFEDPLKYEKMADTIIGVLKQLQEFSLASQHWKTTKYSFRELMKLRKKGLGLVNKSRSFNKEMAKENEKMLGKRLQSELDVNQVDSLNQKEDVYMQQSNLIPSGYQCHSLFKGKVTLASNSNKVKILNNVSITLSNIRWNLSHLRDRVDFRKSLPSLK